MALLSLSGERAVAELARRELSLHRVLTLDRAGVGQLDFHPLDLADHGEVDRLTLDRARESGLTYELRRVVAGELLAVLLQGHRWSAGARRGLDRKGPDTVHVHLGSLAGPPRRGGTDDEHRRN